MSQNNMPKSLKPSTQSSMADAQRHADPTAREGTCPLCGRYMAVFPPDGYCNTEECSEAILDYARREHPEAIVKAGDMTILLLGKLHRYADPIPPESMSPDAVETGVCEYAGCSLFAKPRDSLCNEHRRQNPKARNNTGKSRQILGNRIKGFDRVK
jgi:hypothetical protein